MGTEVTDVVVIGGGLHGLSAALQLARRGKRVTILERRYVGRHSSTATAAGVRRLGRDPREIALSVVAMEMWHGMAGIVGDDCGFHAGGQIRVAETTADLAKNERRANETRAAGWTHEELIDRAELRRVVPSIAPHCLGAIISRADGAADPFRAVTMWRRACEAAGVEIRENAGVVALEPRARGWRVVTPVGAIDGEFVVNAAGAWARDIAALAGETIACGVKASMMIATERLPPFLAATVGATGRPLSFKQTAEGTVLIGGGHQGRNDPATESSVVDFRNLATAARIATELFPHMTGVRILRCWTGIEAQTADDIPVIGPSVAAPGLFHSFGYSGHGFQLFPAVGVALAELIVRGATNLPIAAFAADRLTTPAGE
ncbi:MAG: FAD-binding oxidoreductase [Alphaproteobacteria bacterium]|nr:FAD-binding oxidoreductase [Alphaproteobacteria bacterium]